MMSKKVHEVMQDVVNKIKKDIGGCIEMVDNYDKPRIIKDSGNRREFETGSVRDMQEGKGRCDLLPAAALLRLAIHYEEGAKKYGDRNWEKGQPLSVMIDSGMRHLLKYLDGQKDEDHLTAAAWNILGAMWMEEKHPELQDIPSRMEQDVVPGDPTAVYLSQEEYDESRNKKNEIVSDDKEYDDFGPYLQNGKIVLLSDNGDEPIVYDEKQTQIEIDEIIEMTSKLTKLFSIKNIPEYKCDLWGRAFNEGRIDIDLFNAAEIYYRRYDKWIKK